MPWTELDGPHNLTHGGIDECVLGIGPGVYALGHSDEQNVFHVVRVGRSDTDLNSGLHELVGKYRQFKFSFYPTDKAAFERECHLYHDFHPPENTMHPEKSGATGYRCRVCGG